VGNEVAEMKTTSKDLTQRSQRKGGGKSEKAGRFAAEEQKL
jgi:hypothetical protein